MDMWPWYPTVGKSKYALLVVVSIPWNLKAKPKAKSDSLVSNRGYLLSVMELGGVNLVLELRWLHVALQPAEVILAELLLGKRLETLVKRRLLTLVVLSVDRCPRRLGKRLAEEILRLDLRHVALVARDVLCLQVLGGTTKPVFAFFRDVSVSNVNAFVINGRRLRVVLASGVRRLAHSDVDVKVAGFVASTHDNAVDIAGGAAVDFVFLGCVASIARQVLLAVVDLSHLVWR